jgi:lipopolysaccharide/colanic/teichoic acid biosynthesis glycosyltransferase
MSISSIPVRPPSYQTDAAAKPATVQIPLSVRITKRTLDLLLSGIGLLVLGLLFPLIAVAIRLDSSGPILYRQRRAGALEGRSATGQARFKPFDMFKFRTMRVDAEKLTGVVLAEENDPRVTRVGRVLRKTRLDELPQLWNVFIGQMSVVGPRPERPELLENLALAIPFFEERMRDAKPGITGLAQISLDYSGRAPRGSTVTELEGSLLNPFGFEEARGALADDMRTKLLFDLAYVAALERFETFIATELTIIVKTPLVMLRGLGR